MLILLGNDFKNILCMLCLLLLEGEGMQASKQIVLAVSRDFGLLLHQHKLFIADFSFFNKK